MHAAVAAPRPLVFAHRGGSALGPENTIPAFDRGLSAGADGLELDVHLARDGVVVVHHDRELGRTIRASGPLSAFSADQLGRFDATSHFGATEDRAGVPTLDEVLRRYTKARMIIELKQPTRLLAHAVIDAVRRAGADDRICLGSFSLRAMMAARARDRRLATSAATFEVRMALYRTWCRWPPRRPPYAAFQVPERSGRTTIVTPSFIRAAHEAGVAVQVWTVDDPDDINRLLDWGVDAIISDRPDVAAGIVSKRF
jgi:glycerophosphoryl diester phosphodiesterase